MPRFVVVIHSWFMESQGFEEHVIEAPDADTAELEARRMTDVGKSNFNSRAFHMFELAENERPARRQLTWAERLSGKLSDDLG